MCGRLIPGRDIAVLRPPAVTGLLSSSMVASLFLERLLICGRKLGAKEKGKEVGGRTGKGGMW